MRAAVAACVDNGDLSVPVPDDVVVERPKIKAHGDYATNVALQLAKAAGKSPRQVAELVAARLQQTAGIAAVDVAGPGFLNIRLSGDALGQVAKQVVAAGSAYGSNDQAAGQNINLEFVSANPTGPDPHRRRPVGRGRRRAGPAARRPAAPR